MASLIQRNGIYYAQFSDATRSPKTKRHSLRTNRKDVARRKLVELERDQDRGAFDPWRDDPRTYKRRQCASASIRAAFEAFMDQKRQDGKSVHTLSNYNTIVGRFVASIGKDIPLERLSCQYVDAFVKDTNVSKATQHSRYRHVKAFIRWCEREELVQHQPLKKFNPPETPHKLPKALTIDELDRICRKMSEADCHRSGEVVWMIPLFRFAFFTGMRVSELGRLRWRDLDFEKALIYIRKQKNKKEQTIPLNAKAREILEDC